MANEKYALLDTDFISKMHLIRKDDHNKLIDKIMAMPGYCFYCHKQIQVEIMRHNIAGAPEWFQSKIESKSICMYDDEMILDELSGVYGEWAISAYAGMLKTACDAYKDGYFEEKFVLVSQMDCRSISREDFLKQLQDDCDTIGEGQNLGELKSYVLLQVLNLKFGEQIYVFCSDDKNARNGVISIGGARCISVLSSFVRLKKEISFTKEDAMPYIDSIRQKIGGKQSLKCVGKNPRLAQAKSRNDKNISGLLNQIEDNAKTGKIGIHTFTNASAYEIGQTKVKLVSIQFASSEENHMQFFAQVVVDVAADPVERSAEASGTVVIPFPGGSSGGTENGTGGSDGTSEGNKTEDAVTGSAAENVSGNENTGSTDDVSGGSDSGSGSGTEVSVDVSLPVKWQEDGQAVCHVVFEFNNEEIVEHCPVETWHSGKHILSLYYPIEKIVANYTNTFNVYLWMENGRGTVDVGDCIASVSGQAMAAGEAWDGKLEVEDYTRRFAIGGGLDVNVFRDSLSMQMKETVNRGFEVYFAERAVISGFCRPVEMEGV